MLSIFISFKFVRTFIWQKRIDQFMQHIFPLNANLNKFSKLFCETHCIFVLDGHTTQRMEVKWKRGFDASKVYMGDLEKQY